MRIIATLRTIRVRTVDGKAGAAPDVAGIVVDVRTDIEDEFVLTRQ
jgi:hypothetical protein